MKVIILRNTLFSFEGELNIDVENIPDMKNRKLQIEKAYIM